MRDGDEAARIVAAARACVGVPFRVHGRDPAYGLDCVGVAGAAYGIDGLPGGYPLRGGDPRRIEDAIAAAGFVRRGGGQARDGRLGDGAAGDGRLADGRPGDLLLLTAGAAQFHLVVRTEAGFVHADAGLRKVVETPGAPPWPLVSAWRRAGAGNGMGED